MKNSKGFTSVYLMPMILMLVFIVGIFLVLKNSFKEKVVTKTDLQKEEVGTWDLTIHEGSIYKIHSSGEKELVLSADDFEEDGILHFTEVYTSQDRTKMCFLGQSIVPVWLYYSDIDGSNPVKIGTGTNCVWSGSGNMIAYNNHVTDVSPVDLYIYDLQSGEGINYTSGMQGDDLIRFYSSPSWSDDDSEVTSVFTTIYLDSSGKTGEGSSLVRVDTGEVIDY